MEDFAFVIGDERYDLYDVLSLNRVAVIVVIHGGVVRFEQYLLGNEPDHAWLAFSEQVVDLAMDLGARMAVGLGAYPTPVPHTRAPLLAASASSQELTQGLLRNSVEVPSA